MSTGLIRTSALAALIVAAGALFASVAPGIGETIPEAAAAPDATADLCRGAAWPYLPAECLHSADGEPVAEVRWVTIETRISDNESILLSAPAAP